LYNRRLYCLRDLLMTIEELNPLQNQLKDLRDRAQVLRGYL
jgi:hypothetical protein